jgi:hypothetical protein
MPPKRFLTRLGESIDRAKISKMADLMELPEEEKRYLLHRFCDRLSIDQIADLHFISLARQKLIAQRLEEKIMGWILDNSEFWNDIQKEKIESILPNK